ncbi:carbamate kinase [Lactobacillus delbrueckii subsp. lactis]|jgi:carbamate kinase|uniref:Carbamate kinase n=1 Tax=Lactobacillus delbrueckii subsp. lactis TaxID=29397 RepID=A0A381KXY4_LACDL|nr:carbamate kinase [Lactobacillus delbrueckii]AZA15523.1 MAG: carbamate kinase [Lactobacillus delbrueckii subsp. lactis]AZA25894.1 MAG: carbamate kinase [Lactobacillus delbrueckii subsp. lactis]MBD5835452.1 carbamate kinase [Lactobacillus delbrueckii]MBN6090510.1 carbamate kinase [Lactobacillus delbrueckii subsp. bulgaricus]MBO1168671.1 carbamate kinase [Lactobacillus delbrueckii subsp. lactis]
MSKVVVALGGNALGKSPAEQLELVKNTASSLIGLISAGNEVVISHGNGPQVGQINLGMSYAAEHGQSAAFPFPECGAMSQGYIGYHLQQSLQNELHKRSMKKDVATIVTQVVVDSEDPAFQNPTKPIGAFYSKEEADSIAADKGYIFKEDAGRGWRQVVPSPTPKRIVELNSIKTLIEAGELVIAGGGGGVPVVETEEGLQGVPAVIDKDRSSALLAANVGADKLIILTAVDYVAINFNKPDQKNLENLSVAEAKQYIDEGQFASGSMLPKVEACLSFVEGHPEREAIITSLSGLDAALAGQLGTVIHA